MRPQKAPPTSFRLTVEALRLLDKLVMRTGIGRRACLELAIRELAERKGVARLRGSWEPS
jgi:hypothetical protein